MNRARGIRVLVVEDEASVSRAIAFAVRRSGFEPIEVRTREAALAALEADRPDAILLDLHLDSGKSLPFVEELRRNPSWDRTAIIATTGDDNEETRTEALRLCDGFLGKPFGTQELREEIFRAMASKGDRYG